MRLLAYGGTSYNERQRIGVWGDISRDALEDTYGLPEQTMIYGLGVLDEQPFLVVRQRQLTETGRAYAFSLLLDPGSDVWERFRWNAAGLACALFDGADSLGQRLFDSPEAFTEEELGQSLEELRPPAQERAVENSADFLACWVGAPLAGDPVTASPQSLGFAARPSPREIFEQTADLPRCLQIGLGWLVGGSRESAQAFGARLILDDSAHSEQEAEAAARACIADGRRTLGAWQIISADEEFAPALARLAALPLWEWDAAGALTPAAMLERLVFLADLISPPQSSVEPLLQSLKQRLEGSDLLAKEIRHAAQRLALTGDGPLNSTRTSILLGNHFDENLEMPASAFPRLHREMLIRFFVDRAMPPAIAAQTLRLEPEAQREIWVRLLGAARSYDKLPALLRAAADDGAAAGQSQESGAEFVRQLLNAVQTQTAASGASLLVWNSFPREHPSWPGLRDILREEALRRALRKGKDWRIEYLLYGQDPGGNLLHGKGLEAQDATLLVKFYRDEVRAQGEHAEAAAAWLQSLAESSLRRAVSVRDKLEVAKFVGGQWQLLTHLWWLYCGNRNMYNLTEPSVFSLNSPLQRKLLRNELVQMISESPVIDFTPDLRGLAEFLEELPPEALNYFLRQRPRLSANNYESWIGGWKALNLPNRVEEETVRLILESDEAAQKAWLFRGFSEQKLDGLFHRLLFGGKGQDDDRYRAKFEQLLAREGDRSKLREAVKRAFIGGHTDNECRRLFLRRFAGHAASLDSLFRCLTIQLQSRVVEALVRRDADAFSDEVYNIYTAAQRDDGHLLSIYERALLRYLTYPEGKGIKRMVARSAHLSFSSKIVDERLDEIMSRPTAKLNADAEEEEIAASANAAAAAAADDSAPLDEAESEATETPAPRVRFKAHGSSAPEAAPSLFGRAWGFMKSLLTPPELDDDGAGDPPSAQGGARAEPRRGATDSPLAESATGGPPAAPLVAAPSENSEGRAGSLAQSPDEARPGSAPLKDNRA